MAKTTLITGKEYPEKVIPLIKKTKKSIRILVYDWRWYPDQVGSNIQKFNNTIINAAKRGVDVKAILQPDTTVQKLKENKIKAKVLGSSRKLHAKVIILNSQFAVIGSHNLTKNAFEINKEISVIIDDKKVIKRLKQYFQNLWL